MRGFVYDHNAFSIQMKLSEVEKKTCARLVGKVGYNLG